VVRIYFLFCKIHLLWCFLNSIISRRHVRWYSRCRRCDAPFGSNSIQRTRFGSRICSRRSQE